MRHHIYLFLLFTFLLVLAGCPSAEPAINDDRQQSYDDAGNVYEDVYEPDGTTDDAQSDIQPSTLEVQITLQQHLAMPEGWTSDNNIWTIELDENEGIYSGEGQLPPGFLTIFNSEWNEPGSEPTLRPLAGSHTRQELANSLFLLPTAEDIHLEISNDNILIERLNVDSPGHHFDTAIEALQNNNEDPVDIVQTLQLALHDAGGAPIDAADLGLFFLTIGSEDGVAPDLRGSFNDWAGGDAYEFQPITNRLWGRFVRDIEGYHAYKITYGDGTSWFTDLSNPHIDWDGVPTNGLGAFNSIIHPHSRPEGIGRLVWLPRVMSPELDNTREVYVYLPESYDLPEAQRPQDHPLLIVHDGNESIARGQFHQVADDQNTDMIIAFVALADQNDRMAEYTMATDDARGHLYAEFLVDTLLATLSNHFRIAPERHRRGLAGASLGGLISYWIAAHYPEIFGFAGGMSSSFFWADQHMLAIINDLGCQDITYYLDSGSPQDNHDITLQMRDLLNVLDCDHTHLVESGGLHDWSYWNGRFSNILDAFEL